MKEMEMEMKMEKTGYPRARVFTCSRCLVEFSSPAGFKKHLPSCETDDLDIRICPVCGKLLSLTAAGHANHLAKHAPPATRARARASSAFSSTASRFTTTRSRYQLTIPARVRRETGIEGPLGACIYGSKGKLVISTTPPPGDRPFSRIRICCKGQFVTPKHLRESLGMQEGTVVDFSTSGGKIILELQRPGEERNSGDVFYQKLLQLAELLAAHDQQLTFFDGHLALGSLDGRLVAALEDFFKMRLIVENRGDCYVIEPLGG